MNDPDWAAFRESVLQVKTYQEAIVLSNGPSRRQEHLSVFLRELRLLSRFDSGERQLYKELAQKLNLTIKE